MHPIVIASANGNRFRNGGSATAVEQAFAMLTQGSGVLDAVLAGVTIVELDPLDTSVGYGGLPNADGVVQLDACCMDGPTRRAGGVAALEGVKTPALVARKVADETDHHLLAGRGAQAFARQMGFEIVDDLNTERSRQTWLEWKRRTDPIHFLDPAAREIARRRVERAMMQEGWVDPNHFYGTLHCSALSAQGEMAGVTTTSGLAWKIPGRVGDSPILGAGLYVDGEVGAAGSTGRGEANLYSLSSLLIVEALRHGRHPKDAGMEALARIKRHTIERRLLTENGDPNFAVNFYVLDAQGRCAGVSMYAAEYAICTEHGAETRACEALLEGRPL
ncbi:MAG TPA: N(4)-(beta-N-acetylglucosaminyl)-L-asparaginase [Vicinamibacterales bacterium]|nr:N(4)-(beta-N-acetylglucosaminyl)-L-asparaginase [Vicinamibacterales bacterium]